jgi:hypothetical protein
MEENKFPKEYCMSLETTRPRNIRQDKVREDGTMIGGETWQEKVYNREEWKKLLRTARNRRILHMPMESSLQSLQFHARQCTSQRMLARCTRVYAYKGEGAT